MSATRLVNVNIAGHYLLPTPRQVQDLLPAPRKSLDVVAESRRVIRDILDGHDHRLLVVVGPC